MDTDGEDFLMDGLAFPASLHSQASTTSPNLRGSHLQPESDVGHVGLVPTKKKREPNYSNREDEILVSVWLYTSEDPVIGANQEIDTLWKRISAEYHRQTKAEGFSHVRTIVGLESRWGLIKKDCKSFRNYLTKAEKHVESGSNPLDWMQNARRMFKELENRPWKFDHCWGLLADHPTWAKIDATHIPQPQNTTSYAYNGSPDVMNLSEDVDGVREKQLHELARPLGKRSEQKRRKKEESKATQDVSLSKMLEEWNQIDKHSKEENRLVQRESLQLQKEQMNFQKEQMTRDTKLREESLKLERERMELESKAKFVALGLEDKRMKLEAKSKEAIQKGESDRINFEIMNRDLSSCTPMQRKYFEMQQAKIIAEMEKSSTS